MDAADRAQIEQQRRLDASLASRRPEAQERAANGRCLFCDAPAAGFFCDEYCREDYIRLDAKLQNDRIVGSLA